MTSQEYLPLAIRTECDYKATQKWVHNLGVRDWRLAQATLGVVTETIELAQSLLGDEMDRPNYLEELGDIAWYCAVAMNSLGLCFLNMEHDLKERRIQELVTVLSRESGDAADMLKRSMFYHGNSIASTQHYPKLIAIYGRMWSAIHYLALAVGSTLSEVLQLNIDKLRVRYPEKFSEVEAAHRNLAAERQVLEGAK